MAELSREGKILMVLPGHGMSTSDVAFGYGEALADLGYEVLDYDIHERLVFYEGAIRERISSLKSEQETREAEAAVIHAATAEIPVAVLKELPDMTIYVTGQYVPKFPLELIRKRFRMPQILVLTESPYLADMEMKMAPYYDVVFTNDKACLDRYREANKNTFYLGTAFCPKFYPFRGKVGEEFQSDLFFVGTPVSGRAKFLNRVCEELEGVNFKLFGRFGEMHGFNGRVFDFWEGPSLKHEKIRKYLAGTRIGFNFFRLNETERDLRIEPYSLNPRVYEVMASGALLLTDFRPELEELFVVGEDLVVFNGVEDFLEKIKYYLSHETERQEIAKRGQTKVLKNHSYVNRARRLLEIVKNLKNEEVK